MPRKNQKKTSKLHADIRFSPTVFVIVSLVLPFLTWTLVGLLYPTNQFFKYPSFILVTMPMILSSIWPLLVLIGVTLLFIWIFYRRYTRVVAVCALLLLSILYSVYLVFVGMV